MTNKDITNIMFADAQVDSLYWGSTLVWQRENKPSGTGLLRGKFTDDSTSSDWWIYTGGADYEFYCTKTDISEFVNPNTKEFSLQIESSGKNLQCLFVDNKKLEKVYELPITDETTSLRYIFYGCTSLKEIPRLSNLKNINNLVYSFFKAEKLTEIDLGNLNITDSLNISAILSYNDNLQTLNISNWDFSKIKDTASSPIFYHSSQLPKFQNIIGPIYNYNLITNLNISPLTNESAMVLINGLAVVGETNTLTFSTTTYDTLSPEQIALATSKGWTVVRS